MVESREFAPTLAGSSAAGAAFHRALVRIHRLDQLEQADGSKDRCGSANPAMSSRSASRSVAGSCPTKGHEDGGAPKQ